MTLRNTMYLFASVALLSTGYVAEAAGPFGGLKNAVKKVKKEKKKVDEAVDIIDQAAGTSSDGFANRGRMSNSPKTAKRIPTRTDYKMGTPSANLTSQTKCTGLALSDITIGNLGEYTFQQGFSKEKRSGFINRKPGKVSKSCIITPGLQSREVLYFEVDRAKYKALDKGNDFEWQCVRSDNPGAGVTDYWNWNSDQYLGDSHMKLHCGNDQSVSNCATGSNSSRASAYSADMKKRGKYGISFMARTTEKHRGPTEKLYCQYYNKRTGQSLVGFEYISASGR